MTKFAGKPFEPAEPDPGPGWLRSRFMWRSYPRPGVAAYGRPNCPVCREAPIQCEELHPAISNENDGAPR
jgi:hypothetical protein